MSTPHVTREARHPGYLRKFPDLYHLWNRLKQRCNDPNKDAYRWYGGKGVKMHPTWNNFTVFVQDVISAGYKPGLEIDRIDNDGNYEPGNIRFVTHKENCNNKSNNHKITYKGVTLGISEWADRLGMKRATLMMRIVRYKWSIAKAFTTPVKR